MVLYLGEARSPSSPHNPAPDPNSKRTTRRRVLALLCETFPRCFYGRGVDKLPLKRGIRADILFELPEIDPQQLDLAIDSYTRLGRYLRNIITGPSRVDLDGFPIDKVTAADEAHARQRMDNLNPSRHHREAA